MLYFNSTWKCYLFNSVQGSESTTGIDARNAMELKSIRKQRSLKFTLIKACERARRSHSMGKEINRSVTSKTLVFERVLSVQNKKN